MMRICENDISVPIMVIGTIQGRVTPLRKFRNPTVIIQGLDGTKIGCAL